MYLDDETVGLAGGDELANESAKVFGRWQRFERPFDTTVAIARDTLALWAIRELARRNDAGKCRRIESPPMLLKALGDHAAAVARGEDVDVPAELREVFRAAVAPRTASAAAPSLKRSPGGKYESEPPFLPSIVQKPHVLRVQIPGEVVYRCSECGVNVEPDASACPACAVTFAPIPPTPYDPKRSTLDI